MPRFNLVVEKWIPVIRKDGSLDSLGIMDTLVQASDIREIFDPSPLVTISLHRLLLAILHRNFGPQNMDEWRELWQGGKGKFDRAKLLSYFQEWQEEKHRFDLFDEIHPFYQCASLSKSPVNYESISIYHFVHDSAIYLGKAALFDHSTDANSNSLSPAEAAKFLVAFQNYALGGYGGLSKPRLKGEESAKAGFLVKGAVMLVHGDNLFQTLMLNLHHYNGIYGEPFTFKPSEDIPIWERNEEIRPEDRYPKGYLDLLTWQIRRIKLIPQYDEISGTTIKNMIVRKGNELPKDPHLQEKETMLAYSKNKNPKQDSWLAYELREDRELWRDSLSLFQSVTEKNYRPKTLEWLNDLTFNDILPRSKTLNLSIMGLISNQASISLWRHERLPVRLEYLQNEELILALGEALEFAENVGKLLNQSARYLATVIMAPNINPNTARLNDQQNKEIKNLVNHLALPRPYWAQLGLSFSEFLLKLPGDKKEDQESIVYGENTRTWWAEKVRQAAESALDSTTRSLDRSARSIKAVTLAERLFRYRLGAATEKYLKNNQEEVKND